MANFPPVKPTSRSFKPGVYPQKAYRSLNGAVVKRTYGNKPYGATLDLSFDNIPDASAVAIVDHYRTQTEANSRFGVGSAITAGMSSELASRADASLDNLRWEYEGPPEVESVRPGFSSVRVSLIGEIRDPRYDD